MAGVGSRHRPRHDRKPEAASESKPRMSLELRSSLPHPNGCLGASPHQQGRGTKMTMLSVCGIDVSKDRLDVMVLPQQQCSSVRNDPAGCAELIELLRGFSISAIGLEASGGYERGVMRACSQPACRCGGSIRSGCGSSPTPAAFWPKPIGSMRA